MTPGPPLPGLGPGATDLTLLGEQIRTPVEWGLLSGCACPALGLHHGRRGRGS